MTVSDTSSPAAHGDMRIAVRLADVSKTFPGTQALDDVSFDIGMSQLHALVGGNGSGKSTLVKILAGVYRGDPGGTITVGSHAISSDEVTPEWARQHGLRFVHQALGLFPDLSVAENIALGTDFPITGYRRVRWRGLHASVARLLGRFHIDLDPKTPLQELRPAHQTMVAVARALRDENEADVGALTLVLDEPTAVLPPVEVDVLLTALQGYARAGRTILFISHRLGEVLSIADTVTVLRDGRHVVTRTTQGLEESALVEAMVGRPLERLYPPQKPVAARSPVLELREVKEEIVTGVNLELTKGEILGLAGIGGSGCSELLKALFGSGKITGGEVRLNGTSVGLRSSEEAVRLGFAYVPASRSDAAFLDMSVRENLSAAQMTRYSRYGRLLHRSEERDARDAITRFGVRTTSANELMSALSGGNQQKVVLARWLTRSPSVLLLDEPTQGVDISSRADVYAMIRRAADDGASVIVSSSDFEELAHLCDRVVVLDHGKVVAEAAAPNLTSHLVTDLVYANWSEEQNDNL